MWRQILQKLFIVLSLWQHHRSQSAITWPGFERRPNCHTSDMPKPISSRQSSCSAKRQLDEKVGQMFQVSLSALITKMCRARALPTKRACVPFSRMVSVPKSTSLCKLNKIIFALPSTLTPSPGNKGLMLQQALQPQKTSTAGMKRRDRAGAFGKVCFVAAYHLWTVYFIFSALVCMFMCMSACCLYSTVNGCLTVCVYMWSSHAKALAHVCVRITVYYCTLCVCVRACVCVSVCVWKQRGQELREWQRVCGGQKLELSDLVSESPASQLSLRLWQPPRPLAPPPAPFEDGYPGNWKLFSKKDNRGEKSKDTAEK